MTRFRPGLTGTLLAGIALSAVAFSSSAGAKTLRRELQLFNEVRYSIAPKYTGTTTWTMSSPPKTLEFVIRCQSQAPTMVKLRGNEFTVLNGSPMRFDANKKLGIRPFRTTFVLSLAEGRNRTQGRVKYFK